MRKSLLLLLAIPFSVSASPLFNFGYVEVNTNKLSNTGCYVRSDNDKPLFDMVSIFAANVNGTDPNHPVIYFNPQVDALINNSDQIQTLQNKGIKVLVTLLGNHQNAGWSCMTDQNAINTFADSVVNMVYKYKLDGVDIDDEYSNCTPNNTSLIRIARAIKENPLFKGKILSKALYMDDSYFYTRYDGHRLADYLDYGWEMTYGASNFEYRLSPYLTYGMTKEKLALGVNVNGSPQSAIDAVNFLSDKGYGSIMVYNIQKNSQDYLSKVANAENKITVNVTPNCLE